MRIGNYGGRAVIVTDALQTVDIEESSDHRFSSQMNELFERWDEFRKWLDTDYAPTSAGAVSAGPVSMSEVGPPSPYPRQVFAVALNYADHAAEAGFARPDGLPPIFTKFASSIAGAQCNVVLPSGGTTDWEVELVAIMGRRAREVDPGAAWDYVAGLTVGQDLSERTLQMSGPTPQFGLAKSFPAFSPMGPWLVTTDSLPSRDDLRLGCSLNDEVVQDGRTSDLLYSIPEIIAELSNVVELYPGDVIFTGTPPGVGMGRSPQRFIKPGDTLVSWVEGIGEIRQTFVEAETANK